MSAKENIPLVTAILPVHNAAAFVKSAIESILTQTFPDFELLIVNDGSTDRSAEIIASFKDPRIVYVNNEKNLGLIATLNKAIGLAKGKYIARMDADDIALPQRLQKQVEKMENDPGIAVLATFVDFINEDDEVTGNWNTDREAVTADEIRRFMSRTNCIAHPSIMMRAAIAREFYYKENQKGAEDWDLWLRVLGSGGRIEKLAEVLLHYRVHPASIMGKDKIAVPLEVRLMRVKRKFLFGQLAKFRINGFFFSVCSGYTRNLARYFISTKIPHWGRNLKRYFTSPPWRVLAQKKKFRSALEKYNGRHFFVFPYMHVGGAEKVHAQIVAAVADQKPLVIFPNFSDNDKFLERFTAHAIVLDVAHYVNYPLTRRKAQQLLAEKINETKQAVLFGSNAGLFYELIPSLRPDVKVIDLIHAFKYQPGANLAQRNLLSLASRIDQRIFVSEAALNEYRQFYFFNNIPKRIASRLTYISNAVAIPAEPDFELPQKAGVLFVGRNSPEKRLPLFLEIAKRLKTELPARFEFNVVGTAAPSGEASNVHFAGEITNEKELESWFAKNQFLVLTSSREGFPMVIMEAMAHGLVVISTPVGDIPNRVNETNGIVISSADDNKVVEEISMQLKFLISQPEKTLELRKAARAYAIENFSEEKFRENYRKLLL